MLLAVSIYMVVCLVLQLFVVRLGRLREYAGPVSYLLVLGVAVAHSHRISARTMLLG
ncbi:MAG TPA: hypothetical protein VLD17_08135 [Gemmatimonadaceae bacterium]|nr:hypothetical protein [Gemmatimonadaceae bacterium]